MYRSNLILRSQYRKCSQCPQLLPGRSSEQHAKKDWTISSYKNNWFSESWPGYLGHMEVSLNYCSQNGGNLYRAPYYNRNLNIGPRIDSNLGQSPYVEQTEFGNRYSDAAVKLKPYNFQLIHRPVLLKTLNPEPWGLNPTSTINSLRR